MRRYFAFALISFSVWSQDIPAPTPDKALLMAATDKWLVWNVADYAGEQGFANTPTLRNSFYVQKVGSKTARLVYEDTIGMVQSFVPIWVLDDESLVGWDGGFQRLRNGRVEMLDFISLPGSLYYPVLCGVMSEGVLMMTQNEQQSTEAYERVYFIPWSDDERLLDVRRAVRVSDEVGIPYFWPSVRWIDKTVLTWRPPTVYRFDLARLRLDSIQLPISGESGGPSHIAAYDGKTIILQHGSTRLAYDEKAGRVTSLPFSQDFNIFAVHGDYVYGVLGAPLTKSDSLTYFFQAYDMKRKKWQTILSLASADMNHEIGFPACVEFKDGLRIWSGGEWHTRRWLK